jgi:hypothetical protein
MPHEASMIKAVTASHIVGMTLGECVECGTISVAQADADRGEQQCEAAADDIKVHDRPPSEPDDNEIRPLYLVPKLAEFDRTKAGG